MRYLTVVIPILAFASAGCEGATPTTVAADAQDPLLSRSAAACENLSGTVSAALVEGEEWNIEGILFDPDGDAVGEAFAWIDEFEPRGSGAIRTRMRHRYVIDGSALDTRDHGVLSPVAVPLYAFNNRLEVAGGTGAFSEATGVLRAHGTVDLASGDIELAYHGRLCR